MNLLILGKRSDIVLVRRHQAMYVLEISNKTKSVFCFRERAGICPVSYCNRNGRNGDHETLGRDERAYCGTDTRPILALLNGPD